MNSPIDNELAPGEDGARLPSLGTAELSVSFQGRVKEILETLTGRRGGSNWDRAVTFRDLYKLGLAANNQGFGGPLTIEAQRGTILPSGITVLETEFERLLRESNAFKELRRGIGSADDLATFPDELRQQLSQSLQQIARERQADIQAVTRKIQTNSLSVASKLEEITASLDNTAAGVRNFDAAYADNLRAYAVSLKQLTARLNDVGGVTLEEKFVAQADAISGLLGQWSIKIQTGTDENPVLAGVALSVEGPNADETTSSFVFLADKFGFFTNNGTTMPFGIDGATGKIFVNGQLLVNAGGTSLDQMTAGMLNYVGEFAAAPAVANYRPNDVYKNTADGNSYILKLAGSTKSWQLFLQGGQDGPPGQRGTVAIVVNIAGTSWNSTTATNALASLGYGAPMVFDQVTLRNADAGYAETRSYSGSTWVLLAAYINGNLLVDGTVLARHIDARGLLLRDDAGNVILGAGAALDPQYAAPGTKNSEQQWVDVNGSGKPADGATRDLTLVGRGVALSGNRAVKNTGVNQWGDADVYSQESYRGGAFASCRVPAATAGAFMIGLNSDPWTDATYASIDFAIYCEFGTLYVYEGGNQQAGGSLGPVADGDILSVLYDGSTVKYFRNSSLAYSRAAGPDLVLYMDSAIHTNGMVIENMRFGPLSSNNWSNVGGSGKPSDNATSDLSLIADSTITLTGNTAKKTSGFVGWNAQVISAQCYTGGAFAEARVESIPGQLAMFGLNTDPLADANYGTIDHAIYPYYDPSSGQILYAFRNGIGIQIGTWNVGDLLGVYYDGSQVTYTRNGVVQATVAEAAGKVFYFDSSFSTVGSKFTNIRFGPMTDNSAGVAAGAALPAMNAAISQRLRKDAADIISGQISLQSKYALLVGDSNNGLWLGSEGIALVQNGVVKATLPISGEPTFGGKLTAASGDFVGNVMAGPAGGFRVEMGPDDPTYAIWVGSGVKNDANAVFYLKRNGSGYYGGSLSAGVLKTSVTNPTISPTAEVVDGPFGSNGHPINVVVSFDFTQEQRSTLHTFATSASPAPSVTIALYSGSTLVQTATINGYTNVRNIEAEEETSTATVGISGSFTYTDTTGSTANRTFRAVITSRPVPYFSYASTKSMGQDFQDAYSQRLSIVTTEQ